MTEIEQKYETSIENRTYFQMSVWSFLGILLIMLIPIVGFIVASVWAFKAKNKNLRCLAIAFVVVELLICVAISLTGFFAVRKLEKADTSGTVSAMLSGSAINYMEIIRDSPNFFSEKGIQAVMSAVQTGDIETLTGQYLKNGKTYGSCAEAAQPGKTPSDIIKNFVKSPAVIKAAKIMTNRNSDDSVSKFTSMVADEADASPIINAWLGSGDISAQQAVDLLVCGTNADRNCIAYIMLTDAFENQMPDLPYVSVPDISYQVSEPQHSETEDSAIKSEMKYPADISRHEDIHDMSKPESTTDIPESPPISSRPQINPGGEDPSDLQQNLPI